MKQFCFVDMDGIIADFYCGASIHHDVPNPYGPDGTLRGTGDMAEMLGMDKGQFLHGMEFDFWSNLPRLTDADAILSAVWNHFPIENTAILSSPSRNLESPAGKLAWLSKHYPMLHNRYVFAPNKHYMAGPGKILIDDFEKNIDEFNAAGGTGFLYPRPWNTRHEESHKALELLKQFLREQCQSQRDAESAIDGDL